MLACVAMSPLQAAALGAIQGLTEFLPVSSSAHLYVIPTMLGWHYEGVAFDVALHIGTLAALLLAFGREWWRLASGAFAEDSVARAAARDAWLKLAVSSMPAAAAGLWLQDAAETMLRSLPLQAAMLLVFGFLLWWVDRVRPQREEMLTPGWRTCLFMGAAQAISLVPGVSRSGITITAGRAAALGRVSSARFSFLLATPITLGAALVELRRPAPDLPVSTLVTGVAASAIVGLLAIRGLLAWLARAGFGAFFAYRAILALVIVLYVVRHAP